MKFLTGVRSISSSLILLIIITGLQACGGSGSGGGADNNPPVFTSGIAISVVENTINTGYTAVATDIDGDVVTFSLTGGADQSAFTIDSNNGVLGFNIAPDFEVPTDSNTNNTYVVEITATDGTVIAVQSLTVSVTNLNDPPVFTSGIAISVAENSTAIGYTAAATDADGDTVTFSFTGTDSLLFVLDSNTGVLLFVDKPDYESPKDSDIDNSYELMLIATDDSGAQGTLNLTVNVLNEAKHLTVDVLFPTPGSDVGRGYNTTTSVMCKFIDLELGTVVTNSATANGVALNETSIGSGIWYAPITVSAGENTLDIVADIEGEASLLNHQSIFNNNGAMRSPSGLAIDAINNRAYIIDKSHDSLLSVDLSTGLREVISDSQVGTGELVFWPEKIRLYNSDNSLLVADSWGAGSLFDIILATGDRTALSTSAGNALGVELYPAGNQALVAAGVYKSIFGFDLDTWVRTVVADDTVGTGDTLGRPYDIESNSVYSQYVVASQWPDTLFTFDPATGDRIALDTGGVMSVPYAVTWQPGDDAIWVGDSHGVFEVNLTSGVASRLLSTNYPVIDLALDSANNRLLMVDRGNGLIKSMSTVDQTESTFIDGAVGKGQHFSYPRSAAYDPTGKYVYVGDSNSIIHRVELETGDRSVVSGPTVGSGPSLYAVYDIVLDSINNQLYVVNLNTLFSVDLITGNRTVVANSSAGVGIEFTGSSGLAVDLNSQTAWMSDYVLKAVLQVDLTTGDRIILSDDLNGSGDPLLAPFGIAWDTINDRLLIADGTKIVVVNKANGDRTVLSDATSTGPAISGVRELSVDASRNRVLIVTNGGTTDPVDILSVDLTSGSRAMFSQPGAIGTGPMFRNTQGISVDGNNNRVFVLDSGDGTNALLNVSMESGDRVIVSQ